ncbi:MAG: hypothetical protein ACYTG6_09175 [Planctomycetota bacterium]|jgi:hypothetical protein
MARGKAPAITTLLLCVLALSAAAPPLSAREGPAAGVRWEADLEAALDRAAREGRPVLFAINALETERANQQLATVLYPSDAWGEATGEYVCLVCNPGNHPGDDGRCARYGDIPCSAHRDALNYVLRRFSPDGALISPQHIILDPDGGLAWRKEYFTGVVGPSLLESRLARICPDLAYGHVGLAREGRIAELLACPIEDVTAEARAWLASGDGLSSVGILAAADDTEDEERRARLIRALGSARGDTLPALEIAAYEATIEPDDDPYLSLQLATALFEADRPRGVRMAARLVVRSSTSRLRQAALQGLWATASESRPLSLPSDVPPAERPALLEALLLAGDARAAEVADQVEVPSGWRRRLARAGRRSGTSVRVWPPLAEAIGGGTPGELRGALLEASAREIREHAREVSRLLDERDEERVVVAAALALLGAGPGADGRVPSVVLAAVLDPVEGPDARREAVQRLGEDPGRDPAVWLEVMRHKVGADR